MSQQKIEFEQFENWLNKQMQEAKLTKEEIADFNKWLVSRSCEHQDAVHTEQTNANISVKDVVELVSWAKDRMSGLVINQDERREFSTWLAERVKVNSCLSDDEVRNIVEEL
ncbi:MAG: hypothetical protein SGJ27_23475 [Candidatus Melainabacteria bacterium]|nr:hypothetical protein [Candidatus Melainabacteria bacterium]